METTIHEDAGTRQAAELLQSDDAATDVTTEDTAVSHKEDSSVAENNDSVCSVPHEILPSDAFADNSLKIKKSEKVDDSAATLEVQDSEQVGSECFTGTEGEETVDKLNELSDTAAKHEPSSEIDESDIKQASENQASESGTSNVLSEHQSDMTDIETADSEVNTHERDSSKLLLSSNNDVTTEQANAPNANVENVESSAATVDQTDKSHAEDAKSEKYVEPLTAVTSDIIVAANVDQLEAREEHDKSVNDKEYLLEPKTHQVLEDKVKDNSSELTPHLKDDINKDLGHDTDNTVHEYNETSKELLMGAAHTSEVEGKSTNVKKTDSNIIDNKLSSSTHVESDSHAVQQTDQSAEEASPSGETIDSAHEGAIRQEVPSQNVVTAELESAGVAATASTGRSIPSLKDHCAALIAEKKPQSAGCIKEADIAASENHTQTNSTPVQHDTSPEESKSGRVSEEQTRETVTESEEKVIATSDVTHNNAEKMGAESESEASAEVDAQHTTQRSDDIINADLADDVARKSILVEAATASEPHVATESEPPVPTENEQLAATEGEQPATTEVEQHVATESEKPVATESEQPVAVENEPRVSTESEPPIPTESAQLAATVSEEHVATESEQHAATEVEQHVATQSEHHKPTDVAIHIAPDTTGNSPDISQHDAESDDELNIEIKHEHEDEHEVFVDSKNHTAGKVTSESKPDTVDRHERSTTASTESLSSKSEADKGLKTDGAPTEDASPRVVLRRPRSSERTDADRTLHEKIDHETKMIEASTKLLHAVGSVEQMLEAGKNLLVSHNRQIVYATELQRLKTEQLLGNKKPDAGQLQPCRGTLNISDIRIPLLWKDSDPLRGRSGSDRTFAVFVLVRVGLEIVSSHVLHSVDSSYTDLCFDADMFTFASVPPDFECQLEVYCHRVTTDSAKLTVAAAIRERDKRRPNQHPVSFIGGVGKRVSSMYDTGAGGVEGPKFELIAKATLRVADVSSSVSSYVLTKVPDSKSELTVFDSFACHILAQPDCVGKVRMSGPLSIKMELGWLPMWVRLTNQLLEIWSDELEADSGPAMMTITISKNTVIAMETTTSEPVLVLKSISAGRTIRHQLRVTNRDQLTTWHQALQQSRLDTEKWKQAVELGADIRKTQADKRTSLSRRTMAPSYHDTHVAIAEDDSPMTRFLNRLNLD